MGPQDAVAAVRRFPPDGRDPLRHGFVQGHEQAGVDRLELRRGLQLFARQQQAARGGGLGIQQGGGETAHERLQLRRRYTGRGGRRVGQVQARGDVLRGLFQHGRIDAFLAAEMMGMAD